jgi:hypothetical protein
MLTSKFIQKLASTGAFCLLATLAACGGGGSSSSSSSGGTVSTIASNDPIDPVMPTVLVDGLSFNGVAAVGAPIADGKLTVQCANGASQTTTTAIDGSYSITFKNQASLPCFLS